MICCSTKFVHLPHPQIPIPLSHFHRMAYTCSSIASVNPNPTSPLPNGCSRLGRPRTLSTPSQGAAVQPHRCAHIYTNIFIYTKMYDIMDIKIHRYKCTYKNTDMGIMYKFVIVRVLRYKIILWCHQLVLTIMWIHILVMPNNRSIMFVHASYAQYA